MKALIVDFTGIIVDGRQFLERRAERVAKLLETPFNHDFFDLWKHYFIKLTAGQMKRNEYYRAIADSVGRTIRENTDEWFAQEERLAHDKVPDELIALKRKLGLEFRMGVLCNYPEAWVIKVLEKHNLKRHFKAVVASDTIGVRKPNVKAYEKAALALGERPQECVYLGDELHNLEGAKKAGMGAVFMRGEDQDAPGFPRIINIEEVTKHL